MIAKGNFQQLLFLKKKCKKGKTHQNMVWGATKVENLEKKMASQLGRMA